MCRTLCHCRFRLQPQAIGSSVPLRLSGVGARVRAQGRGGSVRLCSTRPVTSSVCVGFGQNPNPIRCLLSPAINMWRTESGAGRDTTSSEVRAQPKNREDRRAFGLPSAVPVPLRRCLVKINDTTKLRLQPGMSKRRAQDSQRQGKRPRPAIKKHLYLVLDDWERGYSIRQMDPDTMVSVSASDDLAMFGTAPAAPAPCAAALYIPVLS